MPRLPISERRRSNRMLSKAPASLTIGLDRNQQRLPCYVLDSSKEGFRVRGSFHLSRGEVVEILLDEDPLYFVRCNVVWVGKADSKLEGQAGLETL